MATKNPNWWNAEHDSAWDRVKAAVKRDWEQTKHDLSKGGDTRHGKDLDQDLGDTVKQAAGKQPIPPTTVKTPDGDNTKTTKDGDWDRVESDYRYGVGARHHYGKDDDWNDSVESKLKEEWQDMRSGRTWDEVKSTVRGGWDRAKK